MGANASRVSEPTRSQQPEAEAQPAMPTIAVSSAPIMRRNSSRVSFDACLENHMSASASASPSPMPTRNKSILKRASSVPKDLKNAKALPCGILGTSLLGDDCAHERCGGGSSWEMAMNWAPAKDLAASSAAIEKASSTTEDCMGTQGDREDLSMPKAPSPSPRMFRPVHAHRRSRSEGD